ncbi:MAG: 4-(cytidine 5'-diphospho)-2-C-methyl-D-erythritol kinase [Phycisphaerae bacterium]
MTRSAPAKINLTLRVGDLRPDGFHEIESLVARVGLCDTITISPRDDGRFTLACDDPSIPCDDANLALRAARRLSEAVGVRDRGVHITLQKRIPGGAGLGGGSSDAATVLMLLNDLWEIGLPAAELERIGAEIGSDVPLFFHTPLCVVRGRGERAEDLSRSLTGWAVLILPAIHSTTRDVYAAWDPSRAYSSRPALDDILKHADRAETLMPHLFNDLEALAFAINPQLAKLAERLIRLADGPVRMTGSGSALFRLLGDAATAEAFGDRVHAELNVRVEAVPLQGV